MPAFSCTSKKCLEAFDTDDMSLKELSTVNMGPLDP